MYISEEDKHYYYENAYQVLSLLEMDINTKSIGKMKSAIVGDKLNKFKASIQKKDFNSAAKVLNFVPTADLKSINKMASNNDKGFESRRKTLLSILKKNKTIKPQFQELIASALAIQPDINKSKKAAKQMADRTYGVADFIDDCVDVVFISFILAYIASLILTSGATLILLPAFISIVIGLAMMKLFTLTLVALTRAGGN